MIQMLSRIDLAAVPEAARAYLQRFLDLIKDEPWVFGLPLGDERAFLADLGLTLRETLPVAGDEASRRYLTRADGTQPGAEALAAVIARMRPPPPPATDPSSPAPAAPSPERMREQQRMMGYHILEAVVS
jgi:hypothetical protein